MAAARLVADFVLPEASHAAEPPEARGLRRDGVRLLVSDVSHDSITHARFYDLPRWLAPGDVLVVNTSATMNAAVDAASVDGEQFELHFSTRLPGGFWTLEVRRPAHGASRPVRDARSGTRFMLPDGGQATLLAPYPAAASTVSSRLWIASLELPVEVHDYLARHGFPIRYGYVPQRWPIEMYQTVFAAETGSAEMPSAGRPFTAELVTRLVSAGVQIVPLLLHTGVASLEDHEPPYEEYFRIGSDAAARITAARSRGHRIVAVGTTVVRALETVTDAHGVTSAGEGWTDVVISKLRPVRSITGLITGLHEPHATHLMLLEQVAEAIYPGTRTSRNGADRDRGTAAAASRHLHRAYEAALAQGYLWHEFGDSHLII
jgi:S-adenosylmethionine:tRNA ribosyltransferase-isomerase